MKILCVLAQKGGVSKTTLAVNIAVAATLKGHKCSIFDLDPQGSATTWAQKRQNDQPRVHSLHAVGLESRLNAGKKAGVTFAVVDTSPNMLNDNITATKLSDFVLLPSRPSFFDLQTLSLSLGAVKFATKPYSVVLTQTKSNNTCEMEARKTLAHHKIDTCPFKISDRVAFSRAAQHGLGIMEMYPKSAGAHEIEELFNFIENEMESKNGSR